MIRSQIIIVHAWTWQPSRPYTMAKFCWISHNKKKISWNCCRSVSCNKKEKNTYRWGTILFFLEWFLGFFSRVFSIIEIIQDKKHCLLEISPSQNLSFPKSCLIKISRDVKSHISCLEIFQNVSKYLEKSQVGYFLRFHQDFSY